MLPKPGNRPIATFVVRHTQRAAFSCIKKLHKMYMHQRYEPVRFIITRERTKSWMKKVGLSSPSLFLSLVYRATNLMKAILQKYLCPDSKEETKLGNFPILNFLIIPALHQIFFLVDNCSEITLVANSSTVLEQDLPR